MENDVDLKMDTERMSVKGKEQSGTKNEARGKVKHELGESTQHS